MTMFEPLISFDAITLDECNHALTEWGHKMGPICRPDFGDQRCHGLRHDGRLVAVTAGASIIKPVVGGLTRGEAFELARVCASRPNLCRPVVRLWREFVFPAISAAHGYAWAVSYQDAVLHSGNLYRFDGWVPLASTRSGSDQRSGRKGGPKILWGWHPDPAIRQARQLPTVKAAA